MLGEYQKISRVLSGKPFGNGKSGDATLSSDTNTRTTASGTATSFNLTLGSAILSNGDVFLIHQTKGINTGQYEFNLVISGGDTTLITCKKALHYTYGTGAQVIKFNMYKTATIDGFNQVSWNGSTGAVSVICASKEIKGSGNISLGGTGFSGGGSRWQGSSYMGSGGWNDPMEIKTYCGANYSAGGGAGGTDGCGGAGAGHGEVGQGGGHRGNGGPTYGGAIFGNIELTIIGLGSGGGGGFVGNGSSGGGILFIIGKVFSFTGHIGASGGNGQNDTEGDSGAGGAGSGGSILVMVETGNFGLNLLTAIGGQGGSTTNNVSKGGNGGNGRIAIHHSKTITGTTTPIFTDIVDKSLKQSMGCAFLLN